jgi:hypothetical protein
VCSLGRCAASYGMGLWKMDVSRVDIMKVRAEYKQQVR